MKKIDVRRGEVRGPGWEEVMVFRWPVNKHQRHLVTGARGQGDQDNAQHSAIIPQQWDSPVKHTTLWLRGF